jgi:hypothetical protein
MRWIGLSAFLVAAIVAAVLIAASRDPVESGAAQGGTRRLVVTVAPTKHGPAFAPGAIGLSVETSRFAEQHVDARDASLVALMRRLGPGVLRIGGDSVDYSWWTSDNEAPPSWATSVMTPSHLAGLDRLLVATNWTAIIGVNFGHFDPSRAASEARAARRALGYRLLGIEIGNEPDAYGSEVIKLRPSSYDADEYLVEAATYSAAIRAAAPEVSLYGPDLSSPSWLSTIASDSSDFFSVITQHYYPTFYSTPDGPCKGTSVPTEADLLSPQVRAEENAVLRLVTQMGGVAHRETRISETNNTASCDAPGGPETSPVFASALWSLDWVLRATSAGVVGLNFHGNFGACAPDTFSPLCASSAKGDKPVIARPEYYGLVAARELEGGYFAPVDITEGRTGEELTIYATSHANGDITLAFDNFGTSRRAILIDKPPGEHKAVVAFLTAPSLSATRGITFGHAAIDATAAARPRHTALSKVGRAFRLDVPPTSAAIVTLSR